MFSQNTGREVLTEEQLDLVHERAMTVLEEIGTDVRHPGALEALARLGQRRPHAYRVALAACAPEAVIGSLDLDQLRAVAEPGQHRMQQLWLGERIAAALDEQHRHRDAVQMLVSEALGAAGRMQRVGEEHETGSRHALGDGHGGDSATHRAAAGKQRQTAGELPGPM
jgi:hypothetical protein